MKPVLADTGFLVGLFKPSDFAAAAATRYLREHRHPLLTASPVVIETCFFLPPDEKINLLSWIRKGGLTIADVPVSAYAQLEATLRKYANRDLDIADAALAWLAGKTGLRQILTVDRNDFELVRLKNGKRFEVLDWL